MSKVGNKETKPEMQLRKSLFALGYRFRKNVKSLRGKPDIVLRKYKTVIFVNGCFWHGHQGCKRSKLPETNRLFWENKILGNVLRDKKNLSILEKEGWSVLTVWQCNLMSKKELDASVKILSKKIHQNLRL